MGLRIEDGGSKIVQLNGRSFDPRSSVLYARLFPTRRHLVLGLLLFLLAALLGPFVVNINRFRGQISRALSEGLGRRVEMGYVRFRLLPVPGLVAENVTVSEDPAFGRENFVRMAELRANVRLRSLWTGRLSFSSLVFVEPSLNLARSPTGRWNIGTLFNAEFGMRNAELRKSEISGIPHSALRTPHSDPPPYLEFQDGRINFKQEDLKSVFFFSEVQAAAYRQGGRWHLRFRGVPSRTDRRLTGAGSIRAEGEFGPDLPMALRVRLVDASVGDFLTLASGSDHGIHGILSLDAELSGPPEALHLEGRLRVSDLHRWDLLPPEVSAGSELAFRGTADVPARRLEVAEARSHDGTVTASGTIATFLERPAWDFRIRFRSADVRRFFAAVEHFSPRLSPALRVDGRMAGELRWRGPEPAADGRLEIEDLSVEGSQLPPLETPSARLELSGTQVRLEPLSLSLDQGTRPLILGLTWDWDSRDKPAPYLEVAAAGRDLPLESLAPLAASLGFPDLPEEGRVSLEAHLGLRHNAPPQITGWATVARLRLTPLWLARVGLAGPVVVHTARLDFGGDHLRLSRLVATAGEMTVSGWASGPLASLASESSANRIPAKAGREAGAPSWTAELHVDETGTAEIDHLFRGASGAGILAGQPVSPVSAFLSQLRSSGTVEVPIFRLHNLLLEDLHAAFSATAQRAVLREARARLGGGLASGEVQLNFGSAGPAYSGRVQLADVSLERIAPDLVACGTAHPPVASTGPEPLLGCPLSGTLELAAEGSTFAEVRDSLRLRGRLTAHNLAVKNTALAQALSADHSAERSLLRSVDAEFSVQNRRVRFSRLSLRGDEWALEGTGSVGYDSSLDLDFREGQKGPLPPRRSGPTAAAPGKRATRSAVIARRENPAPAPVRNGSFRLVGTVSVPERLPAAEATRAEEQ